jgi:hypothetical protein
MLSFLYSEIESFRQEHGYLPNLVYMSANHYQQLVESLPKCRNHDDIVRFIEMEVVISADAMHPHVAWIRPRHLRVAAG